MNARNPQTIRRPANKGQHQPMPRQQAYSQPPYPQSQPRNGTVPQRAPLPPAHSRRKKTQRRTILLVGAIVSGVVITGLALIGLFVGLRLMRGILPGVHVGDVALNGLSVEQATTRLANEFQTVTLRDGDRSWDISLASLGGTLDAAQTAQRAYQQGRSSGNAMQAMFGDVQVAPVVSVNTTTAEIQLNEIAQQVNIAPVNAGVSLQNGQAVATSPQTGRQLNIAATVQRLVDSDFTSGDLVLAMNEVAPSVLDSTALVDRANNLLRNPLDIQIYDAVTGDSVYWSLAPETWGNWLTASADANSEIGMALAFQDAPLRDYLQNQANSVFDASRTLDVDGSVNVLQQALASGQPSNTVLTVKHLPRTHTVQAGESITSIAWDYGIPYLYIQQANNGLSSVSIGQEITIPPADIFLELPVVPNKRIVVSISQQRTRVYENGQLIWDWATSTGIADSPTWPGVYQVLSHVPNAYAGNWDLYMPDFMGVYKPIPGSDFTNGFHGFPTRGGGQLLWENSLGRRVTYGCILLSNVNVQQLYEWAQEGVVVEIRA
ncbi:MAG: L,D-transpeptidase family protein [Anaerolineae bacterium]|nr:L,D-transpeptidase family protein [Anaerolineae bacterium]